MPRPVLIGNTYYLRVSVPKDVRQAAKGKTIALPVGDAICHVKAGENVKASLKTKNPAEAKARHTKALEALMQFWEALRSGPASLTHKQILGLAGEAYHVFVKAADDNPGPPSVWLNALHMNVKADTGVLAPASSLLVLSSKQKAAAVARDRETRFGPFADAILARHSVVTDPASRSKLVEQISYALTDASLINNAKASGDYSNSGETAKYPAFVSAKAATKDTSPSTPTYSRSLDDVISQRVAERELGRTAKPMPQKTADIYRRAAREFEAFRHGHGVETITSEEVAGWRDSMLEQGRISNSTIAQRLQNVGTVVTWARKQSFGKLLPNGNPFDLVEKPQGDSEPSQVRTHTMREARAILRGARLGSGCIDFGRTA